MNDAGKYDILLGRKGCVANMKWEEWSGAKRGV